MAQIPIPTGLPQGPVERRAVDRSPYLSTREIAAEAEAFNALSGLGRAWYVMLKSHQAQDQLADAQAQTARMFSQYEQDIFDNPDKPDTELKEFNRRVLEHDRAMEGVLTNRAARKAYSRWFAERREKMADSAIRTAAVQRLKNERVKFSSELSNFVRQPVTDLSPDKFDSNVLMIRDTISSAYQRRILNEDEHGEPEDLIVETQAEYIFNWAQAELEQMEDARFDKAVKRVPKVVSDFAKENNINLKDRWFDRAQHIEADHRWQRNLTLADGKAIASEAANEHTEAIIKGDLSEERILAIADDSRLDADPTEKKLLVNWIEQRRNATAQEKEPTPPERLQAEDDFWGALESKDKDKARKLMMDNSWMFSTSENSDFLAALRKPPSYTESPTVKDILGTIDDMYANSKRALDETRLTDKEKNAEIAALGAEFNEYKAKIRKMASDNPDWTPGKLIDEAHKLLDPKKQERAKAAAKNAVEAVRRDIIMRPRYFGPPIIYERPEEKMETGDLYLPPLNKLLKYQEKLDDASKEQLKAIIKEGDPNKMRAAMDRLKELYGDL